MALSTVSTVEPPAQGRGVPAVFLDKDGTLVHDVPYNVDPARVRLTPFTVDALRLLKGCGFRLVMVSNQPGLARGLFDQAALTRLLNHLGAMLEAEGVPLDSMHVCPHAPQITPACDCRKPAPGMLHRAATLHGIDLRRSWMVGDILDDVEAGHRAGCRSVLLDVGNETVWDQSTPHRVPDVRAAHLLEAAMAITCTPARILS